MQPKRSVVLETVYDHVEQILSYLKICLKECYQVLAIVRIHPHTILEALKSNRSKCIAYLPTYLLAPLRYVKNKHAPFMIPLPGLFRFKFTLPHQGGELFPFLSQTSFPFLYPNVPASHKLSKRVLHRLPLLMRTYEPKPAHCTDYTWSHCRYRNDTCYSNSGYNRLINLGTANLFGDRLLQYSHAGTILEYL